MILTVSECLSCICKVILKTSHDIYLRIEEGIQYAYLFMLLCNSKRKKIYIYIKLEVMSKYFFQCVEPYIFMRQ